MLTINTNTTTVVIVLGSMGRGASRRDYAFREKIETLVDFPLENLDMVPLLLLSLLSSSSLLILIKAPFCHSSGDQVTKDSIDIPNANLDTTYDLFAGNTIITNTITTTDNNTKYDNSLQSLWKNGIWSLYCIWYNHNLY